MAYELIQNFAVMTETWFSHDLLLSQKRNRILRTILWYAKPNDISCKVERNIDSISLTRSDDAREETSRFRISQVQVERSSGTRSVAWLLSDLN